MHPLLSPFENLAESETAHYRLIRRRLGISCKQALERLVTPFDNDDRYPTLTVSAQRELASLLAADVGSVFARASDELAQSCEDLGSYELQLDAVLTRCLDLVVNVWNSGLEGILVEPVESASTGVVSLHEVDVRQIVKAMLRPHILDSYKAAIDLCAAKIHRGKGDGDVQGRIECDDSVDALTVGHADDECKAPPQEQSPKSRRTPAQIIDEFVQSPKGYGRIELLAKRARVAKTTVYRVHEGKKWCILRTYQRLAAELNKLVECHPADLYPQDEDGTVIPRPGRGDRAKLDKNRRP